MSELAEIVPEIIKARVTVSHSEVESYLRCERQHYYGYGLEIQRRSVSDALLRGVLGHATLEVLFREMMAGKSFDDARELAHSFLMESATTVPVLVAEIVECLEFFYEAYPFHGWKILGVEFEQTLEVTDDLAMPFVIDLVIQDQYNDVWIIDHKFMYDFITDRDAELMPQIAKYMVGMRILGHRIDKAAYSVLRYRSLKTPTADSKYKFTPITITPERLKQTITEQIIVSDRIQKSKRTPIAEWSGNAMRTANKMVCNSCSFRSLCVAELNDYQPQLVLDSDYEKKKRREFEVKGSQKVLELKEEMA